MKRPKLTIVHMSAARFALLFSMLAALTVCGAAGASQGATGCALPPEVESTLINQAFTVRVYDGPLLYPNVSTLNDITRHFNDMCVPGSLFRTAYDDLATADHCYGCMDSSDCNWRYLSVGYDIGGGSYTAYAYFKEAQAATGRNAALIIPGSGVNQSSAIYTNSPWNYHYNIAELVNRHWDMYVYVKPNEDCLAIHSKQSNSRYKLHQDWIINHLLNHGGSYSCRYLIDTMAMVKQLKTTYDKVVVIGLSQGGRAALLNSLQSNPDGAIVASGFSVLHEEFLGAGMGQLVIPGMLEHLRNEDIFDTIARSDTKYLFTWGRQEKGNYWAETVTGCTSEFFSPLDNVTCVVHNGGHMFPGTEVAQFLNTFLLPAPDIAIDPPSLDFGVAYMGFSKACSLVIRNRGAKTLWVTNVFTDDPEFAADVSSFRLNAGESATVSVTLTPASEGAKSKTLTIMSSDPDHPEISVKLNAVVENVIPVYVSLTPRVLNAGSQGGSVAARVELPEGWGPSDVNLESVVLQYSVPCDRPLNEKGNDGEGRSQMASFMFDRSAVEAILPEGERVPVIIAGQIGDGSWFAGADTITVRHLHPASSAALAAQQETISAGRFTLHQSVPNPTDGNTSVAFEIPENCHVALRVFDASGRLVATLADRQMDPGRHVVYWNGEDDLGRAVASGVYVYRLEAGRHRAAKKMVLLH